MSNREWLTRFFGSPRVQTHVQPPPPITAWDGLHIFVLFNFSVAQPLFDLLGRRTDFLICERIGTPTLVLMACLLSFGLPGLLVGLEVVISRWSPRVFRGLHALLIFALMLGLASPLVKGMLFLTELFAALALIPFALVGTWAFLRFPAIRTVANVAAPGIVIFPALFLFTSPVTKFNGDAPTSRMARFDPVPVVVVVFDEFCGSSLMTPERQIDAQRFPNFAALAQHGTWFRNATSVHQGTPYALPALLSGRYIHDEQVPSQRLLPQNLFSVLDHRNGYQSTIFEPVSVLAPSTLEQADSHTNDLWRQSKTLLHALSLVYLHQSSPALRQRQLLEIPRTWFGININYRADRNQRRGILRYAWGDQRDQQFQHFLETFEESSEPTLHFLHILMPHMPWCFLPSGHRYSEDGEDWNLLESRTQNLIVGDWGHDELEVIQAQQHYLLQVQYLDKMLGKLITRLKETKLYDRCLLVVTADHGISFRPGLPRRRPVPENLDEILAIPLFVKRPGQTDGEISERAVETIDILPTIADVVGVNLREQCDGWSLFDKTRPERIQKRIGDDKQHSVADPKLVVQSPAPAELKRRFGNSADPLSLYKIGPNPELFGKRLTDLRISNEQPVELEMKRFGDTVDIKPGAEFPCLFEGWLKHGLNGDQPAVFAVAVNGSIQATTRTYTMDGFRDQFSILTPEAEFHAGKNDIQFFQVKQDAQGLQMIRCVTSLVPKRK